MTKKELNRLKALGAEIGPLAKIPPIVPPKKLSKYRNVKTVVNGITFDSAKEAKRYVVLKAMERSGEITDLRLQPEFPIVINGVLCGKYVADFSYLLWEKRTVEDVKGMKTPIYKLKKKIVEAAYNIQIIEV